MWSRAVAVVTVSCLVSSVISFADLEDNVVPEDSLQDLTVRTKKSPAGEEEKTPSGSESKSDSQLTTVLTEDIKRKIEDLTELKNAYHKVESDFFGTEGQALQDSKVESDDESVRTARQYLPSSYSDKQYQNQHYGSQQGILPGNYYSNGKYQSISSHSMDSFGDRDAPYIALYNPSSRTFGPGFDGAFQTEHKVPDVKPEVNIHTPVSSEHPVEPVHHATPVHPVLPPINLVLPSTLPVSPVPEHKPHEVHTTQHETKVPLYYEKNEIGTPETFYSKQVIYGPSKGLGEENSYYPYMSYPSYTHGDVYLQPGHSSSYPQGYVYGGSPSYWYAADKNGYSSPGYSPYLDPSQASYNYGPTYSPGSSYQQGQGFYPASGTYRSHRNVPDQYQRYQDELDSLISQFFRADSGGGNANFPTGNHSSVEQLTKDIEQEQKKVQTLQEELETSKGSNDGSGISQSFANWLSGEIDAVYARWIRLKDDISKSKQDLRVSAKEGLKNSEIKV